MPIIEIPGYGPVDLPDGMSREQMADALNKLPKPKFAPAAQNQGTPIYADVPTVVGAKPNILRYEQAPQAKPVTMMDKVKAMYEVPTAIAYGAVKEPLSMAYGLGASAVEGAVQGKMPTAESRDAYYRQAKEFAPYTPSSPASMNTLESIGGALQEARIPPYIGNIGAIPSFIQKAPNVKPVVQESVMPAANRMAGALRNEGQMVQEAVQPTIQRGIEIAKPVVSKAEEIIAPVTSKMASVLRTEPKIDIAGIAKIAPSSEDLAMQSSALFKQAKDSGVELNPKYFSNMMTSVGKDLRSEGYDARLMPKVGVALEEMQNAKISKDFEELSTLRKFIQNAQKSADPDERRIASILKAEFDDYVANIPESSVIGGNKEGLAAWKKARDTYSQMSKSEVFTDMLENAELDKTKFSMSGAENSLTSQLRQLAKNSKKMRLFTAEEQQAIKQVAKGTNTQNILRLFGKFAPTSAVSSIPALLTTSVSGPLGLGLTAGSMASRYGATKMRKSDVNQLAAMMRAGIKKEKE
jgi:hypothetical protein